MREPRTILDDLPFCLMRTAGSFRRFSDATLRTLGLPPHPAGMAIVLHTLHELGDCTVNSLVDATHVPNGTLTGLLDTLERDGLVRRVPNARDGRSWLVQLTPRGRRFCVNLDERHRVVMGVLTEALSGAESAELSRLLGKVTAAMRAYVTAQDDRLKSRRLGKPAPRRTIGPADRAARRTRVSSRRRPQPVV